MQHNKQTTGKRLMLIFLLSLIFITNCMMMGMYRYPAEKGTVMGKRHRQVRSANSNALINDMLDDAVSDLAHQNVPVRSIAVWLIKSQTPGLNEETIRQKLITRLVNLDRFDVVSRQRLDELLKEHRLSMTGVIDDKRAMEIGQLIGVDGFIDGYGIIQDNRIILNFSLVDSGSGRILWAKTVERDMS